MGRSTAENLDRLEQKHHALSRQVDALEQRAHLTPEEQAMVVSLKKKKLALKDELAELRKR